MIKRDLALRAKGLKPVQSLPPIKPLLSPGPYDSMKAGQREETWLSKTKRVAADDFLPATGRPELSYPGSVHLNTGYHPPPPHLEREVDKTKWVTQKPFVPTVPTNRIVSSAGSDKMRLD